VITSTFFINASNGTNTISVVSPLYQVTIGNHLPVSLRSTDRCPTIRSLSSFISTDRWICGTSSWNWEFLEVDENYIPVGVESPSIVQTSNSLRFLRVNQIPGAAPGKRFRVRIRPTFSYGQGSFGSEQYLCISGMVAMHSDNFENVVLTERILLTENDNATIYPNPTNGSFINMNLTGFDQSSIEIKVTDGIGRRVHQRTFDLEDNKQVTLFFESKLSQGLYFIELQSKAKSKVWKFIVE
jgi:hypothetical protein